MKILRTAVVGLGRIGWQFHLPQIVRHNGFELVAVVDPLQERLGEAQAVFHARGYADYTQLLDKEKLDLVVIASPTQFHAEQAVAAFQRGCDVFCDKPMASSLEQADQMIAAMQEHGQKLTVYQPHRAGLDIVALQEILRRNLIGPVYMIKRANSTYTRRNDWQAFHKNGGGMLSNFGAHYIDQLLYLSGSRARRIACALRTVASLGDADDVVKVVIETENGLILDVDINMASAYRIPPWYVLGQYGSATLDVEQRAWQVRFFQPDKLADIEIHDTLAAPERRYGSGETIPWQEETFPLAGFQPIDFYDRCYRHYALGEDPFVPVSQTREVMRVLDACRRDAQPDSCC